MNLLRSLFFNAAMYGAAVPLSLLAAARRRRGARALLAIARFWARLVLRALRTLCGISVEVTGEPPTGPALLAVQHQSALDIFAMLQLLPFPCFVMKQELRRIPVFGPLLLAAGMIPVDRAGGAASLRRMVAAARIALAEGRQIIIFPEGTRVAPGATAEIQPGIAALARSLALPVIPVTTDAGHRWPRAILKTPGPAQYVFHPALPAQLSRTDLIAALETVYEHR